METNPLKQYFRQPAIYIRLPSKGDFYPDGTLNRTENQEYPVLPMTTIDEITYRTPDALFNGSAVVSVVKSCVPNIVDPWKMPTIDIDTILVAIRIATYGHQLDIGTKCPSCGNEDEYALDLRAVLEQITAPDYSMFLNLNDLKVYFRPMTYAEMNENSMRQFEDQKTLQVIQDSDLEDANKMEQLSEVLQKITTFTSTALAQNILLIETPDAKVTNREHIQDWLSNTDRTTFGRVRDHIIRNKETSELKPVGIQCQECNHQYEQTYTLDMTNFFVDAS